MTHFILSSDGMVTALVGPFLSFEHANQHLVDMRDINPDWDDMDNVIIPFNELPLHDFQDTISPEDDKQLAADTLLITEREESLRPSVFSEDSEEYFDRYIAGDR
jgi:hypothetical protein